MSGDSETAAKSAFFSQHADLVRELHALAEAERWKLPLQSFATALWQSAQRHGRDACAEADARGMEKYLRSLHARDLALACACAEGCERAWDFFVSHYRQELRAAATAVLRIAGRADDSRAVELADSLYAELFGVRAGAERHGKSLFAYFHGRSSLSTWLRAILAQRHVDLLRSGAKMVPLEADCDRQPNSAAGADFAYNADPQRKTYLTRIERSLSEALSNLAPRERSILAFYYTDGMTLAEIGHMFGEHESSVSRRLERIRRTLRKCVTEALRSPLQAPDGLPAEPALDPAQMELACQYAVEDWGFDLAKTLSAVSGGAKVRDG